MAMDTFEKIKSTIKQGSGKCVVLEEERPKYVVMSWDEYEKLEKTIGDLKRSVDIDINDIPVVE